MGGREYYGGDSTYEGIRKYYSTLLYLLTDSFLPRDRLKIAVFRREIPADEPCSLLFIIICIPPNPNRCLAPREEKLVAPFIAHLM